MIVIGVEGLFYPTVENEPGRRRSVPSVYEGKDRWRGVVDNRTLLVWYLPSFRRQGCFRSGNQRTANDHSS
jgi:hypothetical protein